MAAGDIIVITEKSDGRKGNYFDGTDDYVLHDAHAVARVAAGDTVGTYTAWIYLNDLATTGTILSAGDNSTTNEYFHFTVAAGKLQIFMRDASATKFDVIETTAGLEAKRWYHVAVVHNGVRPTLYVNGVASAMTDTTSTDLTIWYGDLGDGPVDKFAVGVLESNATHTSDFFGAIGQVKYWNIDLSAEEIMNDYKGLTQQRATILDAGLFFNVTMEADGITDAGLGLDNGTLTGNAFYGGLISDWSYNLQFNGHITGHAAEFMNTFIDGNKYVTVIKKGD